MRASLDTHLLSYLNLTLILFSSFSVLSSSSSSFCELQEQLHFNSFHKAGDFVLGGLFPIHNTDDFLDLTFTSKTPLDPNCTE